MPTGRPWKPFSSSTTKYSIVCSRRRSVDYYPPTLHCAQNAIVFVKCCTNEILCAHRLQKIRGNIGDECNGILYGSTSFTYLMFLTPGRNCVLQVQCFFFHTGNRAVLYNQPADLAILQLRKCRHKQATWFHDNSSTDISSTTLRLQTFRLQTFRLLLYTSE